MSVAIGSLKIDETFTGVETKYSLPLNLSGRTAGDLVGLAETANVVVTLEVSSDNEAGTYTGMGAAVTFVAGTPNKLSISELHGWVRFKMVSAGNATLKATYRSNPVAQ